MCKEDRRAGFVTSVGIKPHVPLWIARACFFLFLFFYSLNKIDLLAAFARLTLGFFFSFSQRAHRVYSSLPIFANCICGAASPPITWLHLDDATAVQGGGGFFHGRCGSIKFRLISFSSAILAVCLRRAGLNELQIELDQGMAISEEIAFSFSFRAAGVCVCVFFNSIVPGGRFWM